MKNLFGILVLVLATCPVLCQQPDTCTISIQARLFVKYGPDAIPPNKEFFILLDHRTFYLMDSDPSALLKAAGLKHPGFESYDGTEKTSARVGDFLAALEAYKSNFSDGSSYLREFYQQAYPILKPHRLQKVETNHEGKAVFQPVKPGVYFIIGQAGDGYPQVWNVKVEARARSVDVVLDKTNG